MKSDVFDSPPQGFKRSNSKGWLLPVATPGAKKISKLEEENKQLKEMLASLAGRLDDLENK
jgi:hypothetical protein